MVSFCIISSLHYQFVLFLKGPYLTAHIEINYGKACIRFTKKNPHGYIQDHRDSEGRVLCGISY